MMFDNYDNDYELELSDNMFDDDFVVPEAPEAWSLDDFNDLVDDLDGLDL